LKALVGQYDFPDPEEVEFEDMMAELETVSSANQGNELPGTSNDLVAVQLFRDQSQPWEAITRFHLKLICDTVRSFVQTLLGHIIGPESRTYAALLDKVVDPFFERKSWALEEKLKELLYHYQSGYPQPQDAQFRTIMSKHQKEALKREALWEILSTRPGLFKKDVKDKLMSEVIKSTHEDSQFGVDNLIHKMEAYYEVLHSRVETPLQSDVKNLTDRLDR
jgi:hypothetical protein